MREVEIKVDDAVLMVTERKRVGIEEGWKPWRKYRLIIPCTEATFIFLDTWTNSQASGLNTPHSPKHLLSDNTLAYNTTTCSVNLIPQPYPSAVAAISGFDLASFESTKQGAVSQVIPPKEVHGEKVYAMS